MTKVPDRGRIKSRPAYHTTNIEGKNAKREKKFTDFGIYQSLGGSLNKARFDEVLMLTVTEAEIAIARGFLEFNDIKLEDLGDFDIKVLARLLKSQEFNGNDDIEIILEEAHYLQGKNSSLLRVDLGSGERYYTFEGVRNEVSRWKGIKELLYKVGREGRRVQKEYLKTKIYELKEFAEQTRERNEMLKKQLGITDVKKRR